MKSEDEGAPTPAGEVPTMEQGEAEEGEGEE